MNKNWIRSIFSLLFVIIAFYPNLLSAAIQSEIDTIHLTMDELDAEVIFRKEYNDKSSFPVTVISTGNQQLTGRVKVSGSLSRRFLKKNLLIKLDKGQKWPTNGQGQSRISLDAMATDGSLLREWIAWQLIHDLGIPGPEVKFVRVMINDQYKGIFLHTEWIDTGLFDRYGLGKEGQFFHPIDAKHCGDFDDHEGLSLDHCWFKFSPRDNDFEPLAKIYQKVKETSIDDFDQYLENHFDVKSVINWMAVNVLTSNGDTYNKNFFMYQPEATKKWIMIPWDYDLTFGRNGDQYLPFPENIVNDNFQYYYSPELGAPSPLKEKTMRNPVLNKLFKERILHLLGVSKNGSEDTFGWFSPEQMKARIDSMSAILDTHRQDDPFLKKQALNYNDETQSLWHYTQRRYAYLKSAMIGEHQWDANKATWTYAQDSKEPPAPRKPFPPNFRLRQTVPENGKFNMISVPHYGYSLAGIKLTDQWGAAEFSTESDIGQTPQIIPPEYQAESCIKRNWFLTLMSPFHDRTLDLQLEYLQEDSQRHELGSQVSESELTLWKLNGRQWDKLDVQINPLSNVLTVKDLTMKPGSQLRFASCSVSKEVDESQE